jgi:hypothetical protein
MTTDTKTPRICDTCPWRVKNHGKPHPAGWYKLTNLKRLWAGLRSGRARGMICHSTDPKNIEYGGAAPVKPGHEAECGGALYLLIRNVNAASKGEPQPIQPPLARRCIRQLVERHLFHGGLAVIPPANETDIGVPWQTKDPEG